MNTPQIYLVEPYNAYTAQQGPRKKHWHEIVEEQALMERIIAEQMALQQAQIALQEAQSKTLPPNSPSISTPAVGNMNAGAGGMPVWDFWNPQGDTIDFSATPLIGAGPLTVVFTNLTTTPQFDTYLWVFGDGTTSSEVNPTHVYQSGSNAAGYTASLQVTGSTGPGGITTKNGYISASIPRVVASSSYVTSSGPGPITATFTNLSINTSQTPTTTYLWVFDDLTSSSLATPPAHVYANTGSFTASLQATGSYGLMSLYTASFYVPAPTLTSLFTATSGSNIAPFTVTFTTGSGVYNGNGVVFGSNAWVYGDGITNAYSTTTTHVYGTGSYTASLAVTESSYNIKSIYTQSFIAIAPTLLAAFTVVSSSNSAPSNLTFTTSSGDYNGHGVVFGSNAWTLGTGSITDSYKVIAGPYTYTAAGPYTASFAVTESSYGLTAYYTQSFYLS